MEHAIISGKQTRGPRNAAWVRRGQDKTVDEVKLAVPESEIQIKETALPETPVHTVIEPPKGWAPLQPGRTVEIPGTAVLPDLAGYQGALQTDGAGGGLGDPAAGADDGHLQRHLRRAGETAVGRDPLPDLHVHGAAALAAVRLRTDTELQQPGGRAKT